jgi:hypothetical protein
VEKEDGSTGGRDVFEEREKGGVWGLPEIGAGSGEVFRWSVVEGLPALGVF